MSKKLFLHVVLMSVAGMSLSVYGVDAPARNLIGGVIIPFIESLNCTGSNAEPVFVKQIAASGSDFSLVLLSNGRIYGCGGNNDGQLGIGSSGFNLPVPVAMNVSEVSGKSIAIGVGVLHDVVLTDNGSLYACGNNFAGQLGIGEVGTSRSTLTAMDVSMLDSEPKAIAVGAYHELVLTENGKVYGCGYNNSGQLGIGSTAPSQATFTAMDLSVLGGAVPVAIAAGEINSFILASDGKVYGCGDNEVGQLGVGTSGVGDFRTTLTAMDLSVLGGAAPKGIASGFNVSFVLTSNKVYGCGNNSDGQLGIGTSGDIRTTLTAIDLSPLGAATPRALASRYLNSFVVASDGNVYGCGANGSGQLGLGVADVGRTTLTAMDISMLSVAPSAVAVGISVSLVLSGNSQVYGCGQNNVGQLGIANIDNPQVSLVPMLQPW